MGFKKLVALLFAASFMLVVAVRLNIEQMYLMSGVLVSIPIVSLGLGYWSLRDLHLERAAVQHCFEGGTVEITLSLRNTGPLSRGLLSLQMLTPRWIETRRVEDFGEEQQQVVQTVVTLRRGVYRLGPAQVTARDPLGIFTFRRRLPLYSDLVVYPSPQELPSFLTHLSGAQGADGDRSWDQRGGGVEMHTTREYQPGDELRRIHWPSTARAGRLVVVERQELSDVRTLLALELGEGTELGTGRGTTVDVSARLAAGLASEILHQGDSVGLITSEDAKAPYLEPGRGNPHYFRILESLSSAEAGSPQSLAEMLDNLRDRLPGSASLIFFTSKPTRKLLSRLSAWSASRGAVAGIAYTEGWGTAPGSDMQATDFALAAADMGIHVQLVAPPETEEPAERRKESTAHGAGASVDW